jgi:hypothetical protein
VPGVTASIDPVVFAHVVVFAHGSGIDDLAMLFGFPTVVTLGFWLFTRQKKNPEAEEAEQADAADAAAATDGEPTARPTRSEPVFGSAPPTVSVNGHPSPFHVLIAPPRSSGGARAEKGDRSSPTR